MTTKTKQLFKILIGAAWIDGAIQVEEREHFHKMATDNELANDPEIKSLLLETQQVQPSEFYDWLEQYLGNNPSEADYQALLASLSALIYSDGDINVEEAKLLTRLQNLDPAHALKKSTFDKFLGSIQKLYRQKIK
ncbi:MAG: TerB family tellurite resistance protein [Cyanothece sp. SIO1E1]|nr:TerB family tellurite resistance protein [Cyanothece sp. SIO1E1]